MGGAEGQASDIEISARHILKTKNQLATLLAEATGKTVEQVNRDMDRDYWFSPEEAKKYGLVDKIFKPKGV